MFFSVHFSHQFMSAFQSKNNIWSGKIILEDLRDIYVCWVITKHLIYSNCLFSFGFAGLL